MKRLFAYFLESQIVKFKNKYKVDQLSNEIESTKSILFKKEMIKFNQVSQRQIEAERVLFTAMKVCQLLSIKNVKFKLINGICSRSFLNKFRMYRAKKSTT